MIIDHDLDIVFITETWLTDNISDHFFQSEMTPSGYELKQISRDTGAKGGGIAVLYKLNLNIIMVKATPTSSFENLEVTLTSMGRMFRIVVLYRPPPSGKNELTKSMFMDEFGDFLESHTLSSGELIIAGDFNFHLDKPGMRDTIVFMGLLEAANLQQHVTTPTHKDGHILDLLITRESTMPPVTNVTVQENFFSDHSPVMFNIPVAKPPLPKKTIKFRRLKAIDQDTLRADILNSDLVKTPKDNLTELVDQYNTVLGDILDKHAPVIEKSIYIKPDTQWYTDEIRTEKRKRRQLECKWRKTYNTDDKKRYQEQCTIVNTMVKSARETHFSDKIANCTDQKQLFAVANKLLHRKTEAPMPSHESLEELAERFSQYFINKIKDIRTSLDPEEPSIDTDPLHLDHGHNTPELSHWEPATEEEIRKIIIKSSSATCPLDPIPTWLLKQNVDILVPVITKIVNLSLATGEVPSTLKMAIIIPLLKKILLDYQIFKNYRPVSNLSFISKVAEKAVDFRTTAHTRENNLEEPLQSAYKQFHSTETALLKVHNDILRGIDEQKVCMLVLLDLSAAFDTVDHEILLSRLEDRFGITGTALAWYKSYLSGRSQQVSVNGVLSEPQTLMYPGPSNVCEIHCFTRRDYTETWPRIPFLCR